jgi:hypothetical protein
VDTVETPPAREDPPARAPGRGWADSRWGGTPALLAVLLALAAVLRVVGIRYGLPFGNLLNPDEQSIVPRAWKLVHGGGGDPHWFDYPTLLMYVNAPFQAWQSEPSYLTARIVAVVLALGSVATTWWLGRRAYGPHAGAVAAAIATASTLHVAYSREAVTDIPLALGVGAALALMVTGRIEIAGAVAGLATGFKYPGVFLVVPLVVAAWGAWRRLADRDPADGPLLPRIEPVRARAPAPGLARGASRPAARAEGMARLRARPCRADRVHDRLWHGLGAGRS